MERRHFLFVPFSESLTEVVLRCDAQNAWFIFPTAAAKRATWQAFQNRWQFEETRFLTMEEWKELLIAADKPLLKEEKRILAFFACLSDEDKKALHIEDYFDCIEPAQRFFDFWEEFNEELLAEEIDEQKLIFGDAELMPWQRDLYTRFRSIREKYRRFLEDKGFCDSLFLLKADLLNWDAMAGVDRVYFVNQFYYTALERAMIERLIARSVEVMLLYQLPEELVDQETLAVHPFDVSRLGNGRNETVEIIECPNETVMTLTLMRLTEQRKVRHVVNFNERLEPTAALLSPRFFHAGESRRFEHTSIFRLLESLYRLLSALYFEPLRKKLLVPLTSVIDFLLVDETDLLLSKDDPQLRRRALASCNDYLDRQIQFLDLDGKVFHFFPNRELQSAWKHITTTIRGLLSIRSLKDAATCLDEKLAVAVPEIISREEKDYSDILEVFYRAAADFMSLETVGLFTMPELFFRDRSLPNEAQAPCGLLKLFLDYLKTLRVHFRLSGDSPRVEFTNLLDTRNLSFKSAAVMNVVEKELPHGRQAPFLLTEKQRRLLGLKTYDQVLLREKYYFFRLLLTTPHIFLLTQRNLEENIEPSSFIEELFLFYDSEKLRFTQQKETDYPALLSRLTHADAGYIIDPTAAQADSFYSLPFDR
ncbi:MAG: hypothetical protein ONB12_05530, partial [candidate division KSB1 bacterium]|nr:hypothetical protein [candidate division KSB1 bacterium]